ncbi:MAG: ABC transporter ATP-binding protein [Ardenticatenaceae bacterium]
MIQINNVTKTYGSTVALNELTLSIPSGTIFGLLGPNGSGKSTLIKLIMGFIFPDVGEINFDQVRPSEVGYLPERMFFPPRSRVAEYLLTIGELSGLGNARLRHDVADVLERVGLSQNAQDRIHDCSKGMLQRLGLAQALLADPSVLVLDEPMSGLDPTWQYQIREIIRNEHRKGKMILLSTHRLNDIAELCTHLSIFSRGRLMRAGALADVLPMRQQISILVSSLPPKLQMKLQNEYPNITIQADSIVLYGAAISRKDEVLRLLLKEKVEVQQLEQQQTTLEEFYMESLHL